MLLYLPIYQIKTIKHVDNVKIDKTLDPND